MARRSLKPQLNQIRAWVRQGRTDAWIAHQLEISASELREFRKQHDLSADAEEGGGEVDLRDEIEAEIEAAAEEDARRAAEEAEAAEAEAEEAEEAGEAEEAEEEGEAEAEEAEEAGEERAEARAEGEGDEARPRRRRRRGRRGGRGRRKELEATFDHGETDGYGLWLDPAVKDNPVYAEHWAGKREVTVRIEADQIVIRRAGSPEPSSAEDED
jgi:hypothetical protein